ncbi:hypothetical protein C8F04DRAFT_1233757 [Mycena alexandri]|uniref:Uncharacterized protein n=1 Tax=Mycena alexandri TaxID=1745969 RepID=A0AAD6SXL8_9AGAR|nr:hypothetical protein C8F04DRAFT_1233757 [Mycena alexandri]
MGTFETDFGKDKDNLHAANKRLSDRDRQYEIDMTPAYAWIRIVGLIVSIVVIVITPDCISHRVQFGGTVLFLQLAHNTEIIEMEQRISELQDIVNEDKTEIPAEKTLLSDMVTISGDTGELFKIIQPSLTTIEKMIGYGSIKADLTSIQDLVQKDTNDTVAKLNMRKIIYAIGPPQLITDFNKRVDTYRQMAYVTNASVTRLDDYEQQLKNAGGSFVATSIKDVEHLRAILPRAKISSTTSSKEKNPLLVKYAVIIAHARVQLSLVVTAGVGSRSRAIM